MWGSGLEVKLPFGLEACDGAYKEILLLLQAMSHHDRSHGEQGHKMPLDRSTSGQTVIIGTENK